MIGAAVAVLPDRAAELRHRQDDDLLHAVAEISGERGDAATEVVETGGDPGHAPARAAYEAAGFTLLPIARYFRVLG